MALNVLKKKIIIIIIYFYSTDAPEVELRLGSSLRYDDIKEGNDVYFECLVRSNPRVSSVDWFHDVSKIGIQKSTGLLVYTSYSGNITCTERAVTKSVSSNVT